MKHHRNQTEGRMGIRKFNTYKVLILILANCLLSACQNPARTIDLTQIPASPSTDTNIQETKTNPEFGDGSEIPWSTNLWSAATPEDQGMDSRLLAEMFEEVRTEKYAIDSITIVRNGYIVADASVHPTKPNDLHIIHSCTKSIVSILIGIAIEKGYIMGVDTPLTAVFPNRKIENLDARKQAMTLEHLLTMTSGFECRDSYLYRWEGLRIMRQQDDWVQYMLNLPMIDQPGERFEYCNGVSFLLSAIIQETTGSSALAFAQTNLFRPLGIVEVDWPTNPQGINIGWGELHMRPHDMAKIGLLYLYQGKWDNQQIISADWVDKSTRTYISATLQSGYGYQWWISGDDIYMALGYAGQFIFVDPEHNLVVVFTSHLEEQDFYTPQRLLNGYIIPAVKSNKALPTNQISLNRLHKSINQLTTPPASE